MWGVCGVFLGFVQLLEDGTPPRRRRELGAAEPAEPPLTLGTAKKAKSEVLLVSGGLRGGSGCSPVCVGDDPKLHVCVYSDPKLSTW